MGDQPRCGEGQEKGVISPSCRLICRLRKLFEQHGKQPDPKAISEVLAQPEIDENAFADSIHFDKHRYTRNLVAFEKKFSLIILCWGKGQKTPIHDHGRVGTVCWVKVLKGSLCVHHGYKCKQTCQDDSALSHIHMEANNEIHVLDDDLGYHRTGNCLDTQQTISLHLYSPPYVECRFCSNEDDIFQRTTDSYVPVVHCPLETHYLRDSKQVNIAANLKNRVIFSNFNQLVKVLRKEVTIDENGRHAPEHVEHIKSLLSMMNFNPKEWQHYAHFNDGHYTRNLIGYDSKFTILLLCWHKGQMSPIHDHAGSNCWVKVLEGHLQETLYDVDHNDAVVEKSCKVFKPPGVTYIRDEMGVHKMGNACDHQVACSLHIYSPPYHQCHIFAPDENKLFDGSLRKKEVSISMAYGAKYPFIEKQLLDGCISPKEEDFNNLKSFIKHLNKLFAEKKPTEEEMTKVLQRLSFDEKEWAQYIHFNPVQYVRNLLAFNDQYSVMLVCWAAGQKTPVHCHGGQRRAWIKALEGDLEICRYGPNYKPLENIPPIPVACGSVKTLKDAEIGLHETRNSSEEKVCISIHIYSPPYVECSFRTKGEDKLIPVAYCSRDLASSSEETTTDNTTDEEELWGEEERAMAEMLSRRSSGDRKTDSIDTATKMCQFGETFFSNFATLASILRRELSEQTRISPLRLVKILKSIRFHPEEWTQYACVCHGQYTRNLIAQGSNFAVFLNCWEPGQCSPIHDHAKSKSWWVVLEGKLLETSYTVVEEEGISTPVPRYTREVGSNNVSYDDGGIVHQTKNESLERAYSLHVYSPIFKECQCYNDVTGEVSISFCDTHITAKKTTD